MTSEISNTTLRKAQIVTAAVHVIAMQGGDKARLKDVADEAGVSLGLVQHYFRTRQALMLQAFRSLMQISSDSWRRVSEVEEDHLVALLAGIRLHVYGTVSFVDRWGFWVEFWSLARREPELAELGEQVYEVWLEPFEVAISALQKEGRASAAFNPRDASIALTALVDGLAVRILMAPDSLTEPEMYSDILGILGSMLGLSPEMLLRASESSADVLDRHRIVYELTPELLAPTLLDEAE